MGGGLLRVQERGAHGSADDQPCVQLRGEDRAQPASSSCIHSSKLPVVQEFICQIGQRASKEHRSGLNLPPLLVLPQQKSPKQTALAEQGLYQNEGGSRQLGCQELLVQGRQPWLSQGPLGKGDSSLLALSLQRL